MITRTEKVRLGIFLAVSSSLVVVTFIVMAGIELMQKVDRYKVNFEESVSGLEIGAQVKYNGVYVGQVAEIDIDKKELKKIVVVLELKHGTPVKVDTKAVLVRMGITGLKFVELTGGSPKAKLLSPGGTIKAGHSFMGKLEGKAEDIAIKIEMALAKINSILNENNLAHIDDIVLNVKEITDSANQILKNNKDKVDTIADDLQATAGELKKGVASAQRSATEIEAIITRNSTRVDAVISDVNSVTSSFKKTARDLAKVDNILDNLKQTLERFSDGFKEVDVEALSKSIENTMAEAEATVKSIRRVVDSSRSNIYESSKLLRKTLNNMEDISSELREQPSLLLRSKPQDERTPPNR